ncbi:MAG: hypothetical protein GH151_13335 [Bacteroidetes bacterium]|nr:hypothetical protein [Bacteroidota bacterium]
MKKLVTIANNSFMFYMSIIAIIGLLWSCAEDLYNPGILPPSITEINPGAAFEGQEVIIVGNNFSSAVAGNVVSFSGTAATITATTTLEITTTVPAGAAPGAAEVTVTTNGKTSAGYAFTVTLPIIPTITSIDPSSGKVGTTVTITGTDFSTTPDENTVSFNGTEAIVIASTATSITTTVPAGATTGNVTVTVDGESNGVLFTVVESATLVVQIPPDSFDDAEEGQLNGAMALESSDLELGEYDTWTQGGIEQGVQTIGLRFNGITIPQGSTILSATIQFTCDVEGADPAQLTIYGENVGDAATFTVDPYNITGRAKTTENSVWDIPEWVSEGDAGLAEKTVELAAIVQEIVARGDWVSGNSMAFIMEPSGGTENETSSSGGREAEASDGSSSGTLAPVLTIVYDL